MAPSVFLILWFFLVTYGERTTYSVSPTHPSDAISIKLYNKNSKLSLNAQPPSWIIQNPSKPYSWPLHLKLSSKSFTFSHDKSCSLNITIHGSKQSINGRIFYVFSVGSSFISFAHDFDGNLIINGKKGIFIYPQCYSSLATLPTNNKIGNIYNGIRGSKSLRQKLSQTATDALSTNWFQISTDHKANTFPVHFMLKNNLKDNKSTFRFYDESNIDIECEYDTVFPANQPFNLFMSTDISSNTAHNEIFEVTQFEIAHDCGATTRGNTVNCEAQGRVKHIEWIDAQTIAEPAPYHKHNVHVNKEELSVDIDVDVAYLGHSTHNGDKYGTTYSIDFHPFDANRDNIYEPGTCSNRLEDVYFDKDWREYWQYDAVSNDIGHFDHFLSYPEPTDFWSLRSKKPCGPISYQGHFTWIDLMQCSDYNDNICDGLTMSITEKWINLTATLYVDIVSAPLSSYNSDYFVYNLDAIHFVLPIRKSFGIKSAIKYHLNLFTLTIAAVYKYKERSDSGYKLILLTESADFLVLKEPILLSYPWKSVMNIEYVERSISGRHCINNDALLCSQLWEIYIYDVSCPPIDLSGFYALRFNASCNSLVEDEHCDKYLEDAHHKKVTLSSHLSWKDFICEPRLWMIQFHGSLKFYRDITFNQAVEEMNVADGGINAVYFGGDNSAFTAGVDTVFVRLEVKMPLNEYIVSDIRLSNVWICSIDEDKYGTLSVAQLRAIGGCLSPNIDALGPYHIIENNDERFSFHAKHIEFGQFDAANVIRFSFVVPQSIKRERLFIHTQVTLSVIDIADDDAAALQNQIRHFGASIRIKRDTPTIINNMNVIFGGYQMDKLIIFLIISLVIFVICMNIFVIQRDKYMKKSYQSQTDLYDTETATSTMTESRAGHKKLYDMIQGLYTSHDDECHKTVTKKKKKKKIKKKQTELEIKIMKRIKNNQEEEEEEKKKEKVNEEEEEEKVNESDANQVKFQPFNKNDTDFTTDIQTLDELTSCTDFSDMEAAKKNKLSLIKTVKEEEEETADHEEIMMVKETKYTYASETEQEKRDRVKLIKQMIEDTEIEDTEMTETEYTQCSQYSQDTEEEDDDDGDNQYKQVDNDDD